MANYNGFCSECRSGIAVGDLIERGAAGGYQHVDCETASGGEDELAVIHEVCTTCWLSHPKGTCDR